MEQQHTPGPWRIRAERYRFIHVYATGGGICHLDTVDGEGAANARLIASAPDLLASLRELVRLASKDWSCQKADGTVIVEHPSLRRARELLARVLDDTEALEQLAKQRDLQHERALDEALDARDYCGRG